MLYWAKLRTTKFKECRMTIHPELGSYVWDTVVAYVANHSAETVVLPELIRTVERGLVAQRHEAEPPTRDNLIERSSHQEERVSLQHVCLEDDAVLESGLQYGAGKYVNVGACRATIRWLLRTTPHIRQTR
jgi:predicted transcriptional regulator